DTVTAIQAGAVLGYQALAGGLIRRVREELAQASDLASAEVQVIATGGLANAPWINGVDGIDVVDPDLTLSGLVILHAEVAGGEPRHIRARRRGTRDGRRHVVASGDARQRRPAARRVRVSDRRAGGRPARFSTIGHRAAGRARGDRGRRRRGDRRPRGPRTRR